MVIRGFIWFVIHFCSNGVDFFQVFSYFCRNSRSLQVEQVRYVSKYVSRRIEWGWIFDEADILSDAMVYINTDFERLKPKQILTGDQVLMLAEAAIS